jgi:hypothetical protein
MEGNFGDEKQGYFSLQFIRLLYDKELAIRQAQEEGMPDWEPYAAELRTAVYRGLPSSEDPKLTAIRKIENRREPRPGIQEPG